MIHPLRPFPIRGAIWYQGESNCTEGMLYYEKMKALIAGWRKVLGWDDFPFLYVQIAPFDYGSEPERLGTLWEAQTEALKIPNTGMAVINDIGNLKDIHPANKQEVGRRLALWALAKTYGQKGLEYSGPVFKALALEGNALRVTFDHAAGGLASRDGQPLNWFEVVDANEGGFVKAEARIDGSIGPFDRAGREEAGCGALCLAHAGGTQPGEQSRAARRLLPRGNGSQARFAGNVCAGGQTIPTGL